jgi:hypothetical protein
MWTDHVRGRGLQPELPLDDRPSPSGGPAHDWRLDERTCRVGRAGVAAARSVLLTRSGRSSVPVPTVDSDCRRSDAMPARAEDRAA